MKSIQSSIWAKMQHIQIGYIGFEQKFRIFFFFSFFCYILIFILNKFQIAGARFWQLFSFAICKYKTTCSVWTLFSSDSEHSKYFFFMLNGCGRDFCLFFFASVDSHTVVHFSCRKSEGKIQTLKIASDLCQRRNTLQDIIWEYSEFPFHAAHSNYIPMT